ncbi:MAG: DUF4962 domain-containing protein [Candidatus Glassbacteria bacterium]|nr:DUF4962 domain-containing protein [Candidatus Glassbacteria bacterium]
MNLRHWNLFILICALAVISCGREPGPEPPAAEAARPLEKIKNTHPRLLLTGRKLETLRAGIETTHKWLWDRYLEDLPAKLERAAQPLPEELNRGHGDLAPDLCFAWLMTGDDSHFQAARDHLLKLARTKPWDPDNDLIHGHLLMGMATAYDWLYPSLSEEERALVAGRLVRAAEAEYERMTTGRVWYRTQYLQNHGQTNFCGLAYAAAALYGEDPRAEQWLKLCEDYFAKVFEVLPPDGTSVEDISYGAYGLDFIIRYAVLSRDLLGRDYCNSPWFKGAPDYIIHSLVPRPTEQEYAITFGDAPRNLNWHGPEHQLFWLAGQFRNEAAQWAGKYLVGLNPKGLGSASWMAPVFYDPGVAAADPARFTTFKHFTDNGQVMMRSSWTDPSAMLIAFKCGPFMGKAISAGAPFDYGSNHSHPDEGSFQVSARGEYLAIDPLYTGFKLTGNHSTMLFKGQGQLGEKVVWMAVAEAVEFGHYPEIVEAVAADGYDYVAGEVARAYHPALGLKKFTRHLVFVKPDILVLVDDIDLSEAGVLYGYASGELEVEGGLGHGYAGYAVGKGGEAFTVFRGSPGTYRLSAIYLDNYPGSGEYSFTLDGEAFHTWRNTVQDTDNHITVSPPVELKTGSRIGVRCSPREQDYRIIKMSAFSDRMAAPREAQWLLHLDPAAEVKMDGPKLVTAVLKGAALDIHAVGGDKAPAAVELYEIKEARIEPFTFRQTRRLVRKPEFSGDRATLLTLIHARPSDAPASIADVQGEVSGDGGRVSFRWSREQKPVTLELNLQELKVELKK